MMYSLATWPLPNLTVSMTDPKGSSMDGDYPERNRGEGECLRL